MTNLKDHLGNGENLEYAFRPSRKAYLGEYLLFLFMMLLSVTSWYSIVIAKFTSITIIGFLAKTLFYALLAVSIILLIKVEYKIWSILYALTNHRIMISRGIFTEKFTSVVYDKITDMALEQSFIGKILNVGKINIDTAGGDQIEEVLANISKPVWVKKKISDLQIASRSDAANNNMNNTHSNANTNSNNTNINSNNSNSNHIKTIPAHNPLHHLHKKQ